MAQAIDSEDSAITGINVTPLVDVVLVLLIILMVTAGYVVSKTIPVDLPKGATGENTNITLAITVDAQARTFLDGQAITAERLRVRIREAHQRDREVRAVIAADGSTRHREVVSIIDLLRQEGVARFAINIQPDELKNPGG
jgi:biopolymer transport protein ExbD